MQIERREFVRGLVAAAVGYQFAGCDSEQSSAPSKTASLGEALPLEFQTASALCGMLKRREIGSRELTEHFISRIEEHDERINAVVVRDFDRALAAADAADEAIASGRDLGPLHGLPMTIKESYNIAGLPTTWGIPPLKDNIATSDAEVVKRFKTAGAHFLGKTNVPLKLADIQSYNGIYGTTNNPWDTARTPGGSSGGAAAALAAGLTALESGSDIGGSIRNPCPLLRGLWAQADLEYCPATRAFPARKGGSARPSRCRTAGTQRPRSCTRDGRGGWCGSPQRSWLEARSTAADGSQAVGVPSRALANRQPCSGQRRDR